MQKRSQNCTRPANFFSVFLLMNLAKKRRSCTNFVGAVWLLFMQVYMLAILISPEIHLLVSKHLSLHPKCLHQGQLHLFQLL